ncbi:ABC transporter transmembrane domain-containing protein [Glycomyces buryatensis]|uniref:ABC transporter ATP-binding protein n=1 Tax=Glycomyces buryatensis TaxID=2570927 RepID=A0A4S8QC91_9ACTN|nr:ABC transporter ATP-binding protein [Glycomyces buryatensis]THV42137.1 ABC transporter ATP-binding protein [Glycomyces buryatensis]
MRFDDHGIAFTASADSTPNDPWKFIFWLLRPNVGRLAVAVIALAVAAAVHMTVPWFLARVVDDGIIAEDRGALLTWAFAMLAIALINPIAYVIGYRQMSLAEAAARRSTAVHLTDRLNGEGGGAASGEIVNLVTGDSEGAASIHSTVGHGLMNLVAFVLGTVLVWRINPWLGVVIGVGVVATVLIAGPLLGRLQQRWNDYRESLADLTGQAADMVAGLRVLRGIGGEPRFFERYRTRSAALRDSAYRVTDHSSWVQALQQAVPLAYISAVTWIGARLALSGAISVGELGAAFGYATGLVMYSNSLLGNAHAMVGTRVAAGRISTMLGDDSRQFEPVGSRAAATGPLHDPLTGFTIPEGALTVVTTARSAIAGALMRRLARYDDSEATWDGVPLNEYDLATVREEILLLDHDDYLFPGTVGGVVHTDADRVRLALRTACATDIGDADRLVADRGMNLSGGQRQRLVLARAIAAEPSVLLAVDPTGAVDAATEARIAELVASARRGRTTAVVTNSPLWIAQADRVINLTDEPAGSPVAARTESS